MTTLSDPDGLLVELCPFGARLTSIRTPLGWGPRRQVLVSDPRGEFYPGSYVGATVGRFANRIRDGRFELDGVAHQVGVVDRGHALHGGPEASTASPGRSSSTRGSAPSSSSSAQTATRATRAP